MARTDNEQISILNDLIETCRDGEEGFRSAAESIRNAKLKRLFDSYSEQRRRFATELQAQVLRLGGDPKDRGSVSGSLHRGWINIKSAIMGNEEEAIIAECERGEDAAVKNYQEALAKGPIPEVEKVISRQYIEIKAAHDEVRGLEIATQKRS